MNAKRNEVSWDDDRGREPAVAALTLVPHSGIQFFELGIEANELQFVYRRFLEEQVTLHGARTSVLHALDLDGGTMFHPRDRRPLPLEMTTFISSRTGLAPFLDAWVPVPFLRCRGEASATDQSGVDTGPSNWVRVFVTQAEESRREPAGYRIVFAFDTTVRKSGEARAIDFAPDSDDVSRSRSFILTDRADAVAAFLSEPWVDEWLRRRVEQHRAGTGATGPSEGAPLELEHVARYLTLLSVLKRTCGVLQVRFADTLSQQKVAENVEVDLVLDTGHSRTTGMLVEAVPGAETDATPALVRPLQLRDLSRPWLRHGSPFESRLEFSKPSFGDEALSRRSGRSNAFLWPSLVRVGTEAVWLSSRPSAREGTTGLASARRHVADSEGSEDAWRFVASAAGRGASPLVSGPALAHLSECGDLIQPGDTGVMPAVRPRFSRSALFGLFAAEVILQALASINTPSRQAAGSAAPLPRRLRRVVLTMPLGTTEEERGTILRRVREAIDLVWRTNGWAGIGTAFAQKPVVEVGLDEAMSAQLVYLYNEISQKMHARASEYVDLMGRRRPEHGARPALRIASIDIGGNSSALSVVTYMNREADLVAPELSCAARVDRGGDDILRTLISRLLIPALEGALRQAGVNDAQDLVYDALGVAVAGAEPDDRFARLFLAQYAQPLALVILKDYERQRAAARHTVRPTTFGQLAARAEGLNPAIATEFEQHAAGAGAAGFKLADTPLWIKPDAIADAVRAPMSPAMRELLDIVDAYDCDTILLTGWSSRLPDVLDLALECLPDRPERIVPMHGYDVAGWYPFARSSGRIGDPKSTAVVGTLLGWRSSALGDSFDLGVGQLSARPAKQISFARAKVDDRPDLVQHVEGRHTVAAVNEDAAPAARLLQRLAAVPEVIILHTSEGARDPGRRQDTR